MWLQLVIDTACINNKLPKSIEAIFYPSSCGDRSGSQCRREASEVHQKFLRESRLTASVTPLVRLDLQNWEHPFSEPI